MNLIKNFSVTTEDINLATKAFGKNISVITGKTLRSKPVPVTSNIMKMWKMWHTFLSYQQTCSALSRQLKKVLKFQVKEIMRLSKGPKIVKFERLQKQKMDFVLAYKCKLSYLLRIQTL
jgi:hypothetical protein